MTIFFPYIIMIWVDGDFFVPLVDRNIIRIFFYFFLHCIISVCLCIECRVSSVVYPVSCIQNREWLVSQYCWCWNVWHCLMLACVWCTRKWLQFELELNFIDWLNEIQGSLWLCVYVYIQYNIMHAFLICRCHQTLEEVNFFSSSFWYHYLWDEGMSEAAPGLHLQ